MYSFNVINIKGVMLNISKSFVIVVSFEINVVKIKKIIIKSKKKYNVPIGYTILKKNIVKIINVIHENIFDTFF